MITRLDAASARKMSAGQVITDLTSVIKELLENALDAGATAITIRLVKYGLESIIVEDNGSGIEAGSLVDVTTGTLSSPAASTPLLSSRASTKQHLYDEKGEEIHRSSLSSLEQQSKSEQENGERGEEESDPSLGFRGEALHSLAQLSEVTVDSMHATSSAPYTLSIHYDPVQQRSQLSVTQARRECGTTVTALHLFQHLPVRLREYTANARKQVTRATGAVKQYALSHPSVRLVMSHQDSAQGAVTTLVSLTGSGDTTRSITEAYGGLGVARMVPVSWAIPTLGTMEGMVSKVSGGGRLSSDQQVFALDGRLVDLPRLAKAVNDAYVQCLPNASQRLSVAFFLHVKTSASVAYDVNLAPNKRKVLLALEETVAEEVYRIALQTFSTASESIELDRDTRIAQNRQVEAREAERLKATRTPVSATSFTQFTFKKPLEAPSPTPPPSPLSTRPTYMHVAPPSSSSFHSPTSVSTLDLIPTMASYLYESTASFMETEEVESTVQREQSQDDALLLFTSSSSFSSGEEDEEKEGEEQYVEAGDEEEQVEEKEEISQVQVTRLSDVARGRAMEPTVCYACCCPALEQLADLPLFPLPRHGDAEPREEKEVPGKKRRRRVQEGGPVCRQSESDLTQYFSKNSFKEMRVLGQFNHGFILTMLKNGDMFIVDQHASDEKYNYERLMKAYVATAQPLVVPVEVAMDVQEVDLALEHAPELLHHGFHVRRGQDDTKLLICSLPVLPYDVVSAADVMELVQQLVHYGTITKPLRAVWHSMATKACRSSIMIGTALTTAKMQQIVERLSELEQPWNCPHGRPTLRLLCNISNS